MQEMQEAKSAVGAGLIPSNEMDEVFADSMREDKILEISRFSFF
jgi:hypothetical protein